MKKMIVELGARPLPQKPVLGYVGGSVKFCCDVALQLPIWLKLAAIMFTWEFLKTVLILKPKGAWLLRTPFLACLYVATDDAHPEP